MSSETQFSLSVFRSLVYVTSVFILIPITSEKNPAVFISFLVYALGKLIDYIEKIICEKTKHFFVIRIIEIVIVSILIICCLFENSKELDQIGNGFNIVIFMAFGSCIIDVIELFYCIIELYKTKKVSEGELECQQEN